MKVANNSYDIRNKTIGITDPYANDLRRNQTLNYSIGFEYFIMDNLVLRLGHFTNKSKVDPIRWTEAAWFAAYRQQHRASTDVTIWDNVKYTIPEKRDQFINLVGYSIGIGPENARNSISLTVMIQNGKELEQLTKPITLYFYL